MDLETLNQVMTQGVPFNRVLGVRVVALGPARAEVAIPEAPERLNHVGTTHAAVEFEFLLNDGDDASCVLNRDLGIAVPWESFSRPSSWGMPTVTPAVLLFFKAGGCLTAAELRAAGALFRPRDEQDFHALGPTLPEDQRRWLRDSVASIRPDHPWLAHLGS